MNELMRPAYLDKNWTSGQCIGWRAVRISDNVYLGHGGGIHGFGTQTMFHRASATGAIVLTNLWPNTATYQIAIDLIDMAVRNSESPTPEQPKPAADPIASDPKSPLHEHHGLYFAEPGFRIRISALSDDTIHLGMDDTAPYVLHAPVYARLQAPSRFRVQNGRAAGETIHFVDNRFTLGGLTYRRISHD